MATENPRSKMPWTKSEILGVVLIAVAIIVGLGLTWFGPTT